MLHFQMLSGEIFGVSSDWSEGFEHFITIVRRMSLALLNENKTKHISVNIFLFLKPLF